MIDLDLLRRVLDVDDRVAKRLAELGELEVFVRHLEQYMMCDPYNMECLAGYGNYTREIEDWLWLYDKVGESEPGEILESIKWRFKPIINYADAELLRICREKDWGDCIDVNAKLPLDQAAKTKILEEIKKKLSHILERLPVEYLRIIMSIKEILEGIEKEIHRLQEDYKRLRQDYQELLKQAIKR